MFSDSEIIEKLNNIRKDKVEDKKEPDKLIDVPSATEIFHSLEVVFKLLKKQKIDTIQLLQLKQMRDLAAVNLRQTTIIQTIQ